MRNILYRTIATLSFFTRLPFWRLANVPKEYYEKVVPLWPVAGWVTSLCMTATYLITVLAGMPVSTGVIAAIITRILVTGALHEDGFADFCDGFGGGTSRERTLEIMKDSHIGTYGVLGLILYFLLLYNIMPTTVNVIALTLLRENTVSMSSYYGNPAMLLPIVMITADIMSKAVSSTIIYSLPYARKESEAKNRLIYSKTPLSEKILTLCVSILPCAIITIIFAQPLLKAFAIATAGAFVMRFMLVSYMRKRIQGYTGDCCGAMLMLCEITFYITFVAVQA